MGKYMFVSLEKRAFTKKPFHLFLRLYLYPTIELWLSGVTSAQIARMSPQNTGAQA